MNSNLVTIEIIKEKAGMLVGDQRKVKGNIAKALIQRGIAKVVEEKKSKPIKDEESIKPEESTKEVSNESLTLSELRVKFPDIKATSKNVFLKKIEDANTK